MINHKTIGFLSNTGSDSLKNHNASMKPFNVAQEKRKKMLSELGPIRLTKLSGSAHVFAHMQ